MSSNAKSIVIHILDILLFEFKHNKFEGIHGFQ